MILLPHSFLSDDTAELVMERHADEGVRVPCSHAVFLAASRFMSLYHQAEAMACEVAFVFFTSRTPSMRIFLSAALHMS